MMNTAEMLRNTAIETQKSIEDTMRAKAVACIETYILPLCLEGAKDKEHTQWRFQRWINVADIRSRDANWKLVRQILMEEHHLWCSTELINGELHVSWGHESN